LSTFTASAGRFAAAGVAGSPVRGSTADVAAAEFDDDGEDGATLPEAKELEAATPDDGAPAVEVTLERALVQADVTANPATSAIPRRRREIRAGRAARVCDELSGTACCT
jgi:hypothetical protein